MSRLFQNSKPHAVLLAGANSYQYDANGNMTNRPGQTITYDYDNRPIAISSTTFVYDYAGQRIKKNNTIYIGKLYECTSGACTKYIFAGSSRIASKTTAATYYYHTDHLGSSSVITDSSGTKVQEVYYYPFGGTRLNQGSVNVKHKYTGQEEDPETGLYFYNARYYDPQLGRFISADSIVGNPSDPQDLNRYTYAGNNLLIYTDPTGHFRLKNFLKQLTKPQTLLTIAVTAVAFYSAAAIVASLNQAAAYEFALVACSPEVTVAPTISAAAQAGIYAGAGAVSGGIGSAINGSNIGQGALIGGVSGALGSLGIPNIPLFGNSAVVSRIGSIGNRLFNTTLTGAVLGATYAGITGGNIARGAGDWAAAWGIGEAANMMIGHGIGYAMSDSHEFKDGKFYYYKDDQQVFTVGGVIIGDKEELDLGAPVNDGRTRTNEYTVREHEIMKHGPQQTIMGPAYLPLHITAQGFSLIVTGGKSTHRMNLFERGAYESY